MSRNTVLDTRDELTRDGLDKRITSTNVRDLAMRYGLSSADFFIDKHPHPFLIQMTSQEGANENILDCPVFYIKKYHTNEKQDHITVGRTKFSDIVLEDGRVSTFHGFFKPNRGIWFYTDTGSSNGSYIERRRLEPKTSHKLNDGTEIHISRRLSFQFIQGPTMHDYIIALYNGAHS